MKVIIVGAGKLGYKLAEALLNGDNYVVIVDRNEQLLERINDQLDVLTIRANGVQIGTLENLNVSEFDLVIAVTESDEKNIIICSIVKKLGTRTTIARVRDPEYVKQIEFIKKEMNIDHIVNPELATSNEIFRNLVKNYALHTECFVNGKVSMIDVNIDFLPDNLANQCIKDVATYFDDMLIVAISRNGKIIIPHGLTQLEPGDILYIIGKKTKILEFTRFHKLAPKDKAIKKVMILGGGKIGYYLADKLTSININVKIVEINEARCQYLSENLDNTLILHGDGTDIKLLEQEDFSSSNAFIATTGYDEENLLMALLAKQAGVEKVIAKISRPNYIDIIEKLGIDMAINPVNITASNILRYIQGGKIVAASLLLLGQAEVIELIVNDKMSIVNKKISTLGLPKGIIIGPIVRGKEVIIPKGNNIILPKDRVIIFCLLSELNNLETLIKPQKGGLFSELSNRYKGSR